MVKAIVIFFQIFTSFLTACIILSVWKGNYEDLWGTVIYSVFGWIVLFWLRKQNPKALEDRIKNYFFDDE